MTMTTPDDNGISIGFPNVPDTGLPDGSMGPPGGSGATGGATRGDFGVSGGGSGGSAGENLTGGGGGLSPVIGHNQFGQPVYRPAPGKVVTIYHGVNPITVFWRNGTLVFKWTARNGEVFLRPSLDQIIPLVAGANARRSGGMNALFGKPWSVLQNLTIDAFEPTKQIYNRVQAIYRNVPAGWAHAKRMVHEMQRQWELNHPAATNQEVVAASLRVWREVERRFSPGGTNTVNISVS